MGRDRLVSSLLSMKITNLFIESDSVQAQEIFTRTGKAVYCIEDGVFYSN